MVRALAGDSTMTRFFGTAGSVAPGPSRALTRGRPVSVQAGSDLADPAQEVLVDLEVGLRLGGLGRRPSGSCASAVAARASRRPDRVAPAGISTNRMCRYGKKKIDPLSSTKTGRLPFIWRRFVQRRPTSPGDGAS